MNSGTQTISAIVYIHIYNIYKRRCQEMIRLCKLNENFFDLLLNEGLLRKCCVMICLKD